MDSRVMRPVAVWIFVALFLLTFLAYVGLYTSDKEVLHSRYRIVDRPRPKFGLKGTRSFNSKSNHPYKGKTLQSEPALKGRNERQKPRRKSTDNDHPPVSRGTYLKKSDNQDERLKPMKDDEENKLRTEKPLRKSSRSNASQAETNNLGTANHVEATEKTCTPRKFFKCCQPVTALASFPGSGNTWVRHLLEQATGYYTGSVYNDHVLKAAGFKGEGRTNGTVVAVKTHHSGNSIEVKYDRVIFLTRSLSSCLLAEFKRKMGGGHDAYMQTNFTRFFIKTSAWWQHFHESWYSRDLPMLVVRYEDLKTDLRQQLKRMVKFLDLPITEKRLNCVVENSEGKFHRKPQTGGLADIDPFAATLKTAVDDLEKEAQERKEAWEKRTKQNKAKRKKKVKANNKAVH